MEFQLKVFPDEAIISPKGFRMMGLLRRQEKIGKTQQLRQTADHPLIVHTFHIESSFLHYTLVPFPLVVNYSVLSRRTYTKTKQ